MIINRPIVDKIHPFAGMYFFMFSDIAFTASSVVEVLTSISSRLL